MSVELKSKKTGKITILSDSEYKEMVQTGFNMKIYTVTVLSAREIIPRVIKDIPKELKKKK